MKYYIALFQKVKDYYKTQTTNSSEITLICPSLRVYEDSEMKLLLPQILIEEKLKGEALLKKQDISFQLNSIPSSDRYWDINPSNTLFDAYDKIINVKQEINEHVDETENLEARKVLYDDKGKATKEKKAYDKYLGLFDKLLKEWEEHVVKYNDLTSDDEKTVWLEKLNNILLRKEKLIVDHKLLGYKETVEKAMGKINKTDGFDVFLANLVNSRNVMENAKKTGLQSSESYYDINFIPYDFMSNDSGWIKLSIDKKELEELYEIAKIQKDDFPEEIITIDYDEKNIIGIELEFSIVAMQRSWFSVSSMASSFFKWSEAKSISDGETISNELMLPAFPKKMILIKNLKINIDPNINSSDVSNINQLIYFGPIIMKNQMFVNSNNNVKFIKAIRNKETLRSDNVKYYSNKTEINRMSIATEIKPLSHAPMNGISRAAIARPVITRPLATPTPVVAAPVVATPVVAAPVMMSAVLFQPALVLSTIDIDLATIVVNVKDSVTKKPIYKSEISIIGTNNNVFKEIETNEAGTTNIQLPVGNYKIKIIRNDYRIFEETLSVENKNTITKEYSLLPESVNYDSFFLIGMVCEKLPKIPR